MLALFADMAGRLKKLPGLRPSLPSEQSADLEDRPSVKPPKRRRATHADEQALYEHNPGFADFLPWVEYLEQHQCFLLEDGRSVGAVFELIPLATEGREASWLQDVRDQVEDALQDSLSELEDSPWVVQFFCQDEQDFSQDIQQLKAYIQSRDTDKATQDKAFGTALTEQFLELTAHHLKAIGKEGGLFVDKNVSGLPWRGQKRRIRLVLYRYVPENERHLPGQEPVARLAQMRERLSGGLSSAGIAVKTIDGKGFYDWLMPWFNPAPKLARDLGETPADFYAKAPYPEYQPEPNDPGLLPLPFDHDFAEQLLYSHPRSDVDKGLWYFDGKPHAVQVVEKLRRAPLIGQISGEIEGGHGTNALFDQCPEGSVMALTLVITPQDLLEERLNRLYKKAIGDNLDSEQTRDDVQVARQLIGSKHKLYQGTLAFFLRGENERDLHYKRVQLANKLQSAGLSPVQEGEEVAACNSYLRWLPMGFNPQIDTRRWYTQLMFAQHVANLAPVWGRATGTGHPGISLFNRGGSPVTFDPLNRADRAMNAHMLIFGPTGAGKSASLVTLTMQLMSLYRPRLFVVEAGNSFGLLAEFLKLRGLSVNQVSLKPGSAVSLAPFADAKLLVEKPDFLKDFVESNDEDSPWDESQDNEKTEEDEERDVLGELAIIAKLMITGGEEREIARMTRADESRIKASIIEAAERCAAENRPVLTEDIIAAIEHKADEEAARAQERGLSDSARSDRLRDMADAMRLFTQGFDGKVFNRAGTPWPDVDVTIVDLATYARENYEAQMAVSYISLMNTVNNIAERDQYSGRDIVMITDEGHIITKNPLVAPYAVKITKMWRKLRAWFWLATQNLKDFPNSAETLLNMIEWWICLVMPKQEIADIARFKSLTDAQKSLLLSANKEPGKYTEGVVLSRNHEFLFRSVPPSLFLALAMTEGEEKRERRLLMDKHGCSELEAAFYVAEKLDRARGIEPLPWKHLFNPSTDKTQADSIASARLEPTENLEETGHV